MIFLAIVFNGCQGNNRASWWFVVYPETRIDGRMRRRQASIRLLKWRWSRYLGSRLYLRRYPLCTKSPSTNKRSFGFLQTETRALTNNAVPVTRFNLRTWKYVHTGTRIWWQKDRIRTHTSQIQLHSLISFMKPPVLAKGLSVRCLFFLSEFRLSVSISDGPNCFRI